MTPLAEDPGWTRLLAAARRTLEVNGGSLSARITLVFPTEAERLVVIGITGVHRDAAARQVRVSLTEVDTYLREAFGQSLSTVLSETAPLRDRPAEKRRLAAAREAALASASRCRYAGQEWYERWLATISSDGSLTRLLNAGGDFARVIRVLDALPAADEPRPVFAERVLGDTKALADAGLVLKAIAAWQGLEPPATAEQERATWESVGVIPDDLASQVLVLNLPGTGGLVGRWLTEAADAGIPLRLTLHQLRIHPLWIDVPHIFVTENPGVLRAAVALGPAAPPMVCTEGVPSAALHRLLGAAPSVTLWWRHDFDWPGVRMMSAALARYRNARPWRMSVADYAVFGAEGPSLVGSPAPTPWDPGLAATMSMLGRAVMEERLLPLLLDDLRAAVAH